MHDSLIVYAQKIAFIPIGNVSQSLMGVAKTLVRGQRVRVRQNGKEKYDETSFLMKLERITKYDNGRRL